MNLNRALNARRNFSGCGPCEPLFLFYPRVLVLICRRESRQDKQRVRLSCNVATALISMLLMLLVASVRQSHYRCQERRATSLQHLTPERLDTS